MALQASASQACYYGRPESRLVSPAQEERIGKGAPFMFEGPAPRPPAHGGGSVAVSRDAEPGVTPHVYGLVSSGLVLFGAVTYMADKVPPAPA